MNMRFGCMKRLLAALCLWAVLASALAMAAMAEEKAADITKKCAIKVSEGAKGKLTDGNVRTTWVPEHSGAYVGVKLPDGVTPGWLRVEWLFDPTGYELIEYAGDMSVLRTRDESCTFPNIYSMYELLPETKYIQLKLTQKDQKICTLAVYSAGQLPSDVQVWNPPVEKADLMVISTHQDDELIFLGGTIPYYATALKKPTIVVYMTNCSRYRRNEALNALWVMGVRDYPEFINLPDKRVKSINEGLKLWDGKENVLAQQVARIRRYKPEVIVTQDLNGEYGHNQHKITARAVKYAIDAAADPSQFPESYQQYGAWQVKKLYHHLYKENELMMDWETPLDSLKGYSPLKVAQIGMNEHASQLKYYSVKSHGTYDNAKFGLYFTTVGEDVAKNDFLEHIDPDASAKYLEAHADEIAQRQETAEADAGEAPEAEPFDAGPEGDEPDAENDADIDADDEPWQDAALEPDGDIAADALAIGDGEAAEPALQAVPERAPDAVAESTPTPQPLLPQATAQPARAAEKSGGGTALAAVMIGAGVAAVGAGGWYGWRMLGGNRRRRRRKVR